MADDDIESCWDEIRPHRVPAPRDMSRYAKQVRESSELTDEEWDMRAALIRASIPAEDQRAGDPRSYLSHEIRAASSQVIPPEIIEALRQGRAPDVSMGCHVGEDLSDLWERPPPLTTPNPDPPVVQPQRTPEQIAAWNRSEEESRQRIRSRDEALREGAERGRILAPIRQALIAELGREPTIQELQDAGQALRYNETMTETRDRLRAQEHSRRTDAEMQQVARGDFSSEIRTIREARERELGRPLMADELDQVVREAFSNQSSPMQAASEAYQQGREEGLRILRDEAELVETQAVGLPGTQAEWDRVIATLESPTLAEGLRRILNDNPSPELQRRRDEYARLARGMGLPEGSITVEQADPALVDQLSHSAPIGAALELLRDQGPFTRPSAPPHEYRLTDAEWNERARNLRGVIPPEDQQDLVDLRYYSTEELARAGFTRPTAPAVPRATGAGDQEFHLTNFILTRLTNDLRALGFPPESITLDHSSEGEQSLTIHMPMTQLTQLIGPGHSSVIFTQRR